MTNVRAERLKRVSENRWRDATLILDRVDDVHNVGAILRSCEAFGLSDVHLCYPEKGAPKRSELKTKAAAAAAKWLQIHIWTSADELADELKGRGFKIYTTKLGAEAIPYDEVDLTKPIAIVIGNEHAGVSPELSALADGNILIPLQGLTQSLNVSVAAAVIVSELVRQRRGVAL